MIENPAVVNNQKISTMQNDSDYRFKIDVNAKKNE